MQLMEEVIFICSKECAIEYYPHGLANLSIPLLYSLFEEINPDIATSPNYKIHLSQDELEGMESKLFWMLYILCEDHKAKELLEDPTIAAAQMEEMVSSSDPELYTYLKENLANFIKFGSRWLTSFMHFFRQLPLFMLLWDKYMTHLAVLSTYHACVCSSFLLYHSNHLKTLSSADLHKFLAHPGQNVWKYEDFLSFIQFVDKQSEAITVSY